MEKELRKLKNPLEENMVKNNLMKSKNTIVQMNVKKLFSIKTKLWK